MGTLQSFDVMFGAAGAVMNTAQAYQDAEVRRREAELAADSLEAQAARKDLEAGEAIAIGRLNQAEHAVAGRRERAELKTSYAASGVKVDSGSALDAAADRAAWSEYERQKLEYEAELESWGLRYDAALLRREAENTRAGAASSGNTASALISGASRLTGLMKK